MPPARLKFDSSHFIYNERTLGRIAITRRASADRRSAKEGMSSQESGRWRMAGAFRFSRTTTEYT